MISKTIVDSELKLEDAIKQNPLLVCPDNVIKRQKLIDVSYFSFDEKLHLGQIVIAKDLVQEIVDFFDLIRSSKFPLTSVIPISDSKFKWSDKLSMEADNTSGFNYRKIARTDRLSNHAFGRAIDINPRLNPYIKGKFVEPSGASYDIQKAGTILNDSEIVKFFRDRGWIWGGNWKDRIDYQHFEKPL